MEHDPEDLVLRYIERPRPELKDLIMVQYTGLVERVARKFAGIEPHQDLVQVGFMGLLNALSKYDPAANVRFTTYSTHLIAGEIKHYLRDRSQTIRQPAWLQELRHKVNRASGKLTVTTGKAPSADEIARELGVNVSQVQEVLNTQDTLRVASLDSARTGDEETQDIDRIDAAEPCLEQMGVEERMVLEKAMSQLRDLERHVLIHFHFDSYSQSEIAKRLGISPNYVSHVLRQAQAKLRRIMQEEELKDQLLRPASRELDFDIVDRATGAYTETYLRTRLQEELHRSSSTDGDTGLLILEFGGIANLDTGAVKEEATKFLTEAAEFLRGNVRRLDIVTRFGESGFAVILPHAGHNVSVVRSRLAAKIVNWIAAREDSARLSIHIGTSWYPNAGDGVNELVNAATLSLSPVAV